MKKILLTIFLLMGTFSFAQFGTISGVPLTGSCRSHPQLGINVDSANTTLYICGNSGAWQQVTGSGTGILSINGDTTPAQTIVQGTGISVATVGGVTTISNTGTSVPCTTTPNSIQYDNAGALGCVTPFTFTGSTINSSSSGILNLHLSPVTTGFLPPAAAGANPVTAGVVAFDTTKERLVSGNGSITLSYLTPPDLAFTSPTGTVTIGGTSPAQTFDIPSPFPAGRNFNLIQAWAPNVCVVQGSQVSLGGSWTLVGMPNTDTQVGSSTTPNTCAMAFPTSTAGTQYAEWSKTLESDFKSNSLLSVILTWYSDTTTGNMGWDIQLGCGINGVSIQPTYGSVIQQTTTVPGTTKTQTQTTFNSPSFTCAANQTMWVRVYLDATNTSAVGNGLLMQGGLEVNEILTKVSQ